ncbi:MAG: amidohydrolase family protein [Chloroflexota bacterium]|nr:amidohydrolase family protein [Chloroflexota bacterium]
MLDLLLVHGHVIDGTGRPMFRADVGIEDGRIAAVGDLANAQAAQVLDCQGLCVSPGWVDIHGHADWTVLDHPIGLNLLIQGCTTTVSGNCGMCPAPVCGEATRLLTTGAPRETPTLKVLTERFPTLTWRFSDFLNEVERARPGVNYVQLAGHNDLRRCVVGHEQRAATKDELEEMEALLEACLDEGAFGMSSGLVFIPGCWSNTDELVELCKLVARRDGVYTSHIRGERETNIEATREIIEIGERAGVRAHISHMQSKYPVLGNAVMKLEMLQKARERGVDIACDSEAFPDCSTTPAGFLQIYWYTPEKLMQQLSTPEGRAEIKQRMRTTDPWHPQGRFGPGGVPFRRAWDRVRIYDCPHDRSLQGKTVAQVAAQRGIEFEDALFDLAVAEKGKGPMFIHDYIEDEHFRTASWPYCIFPSVDTGLFDPATEFTALDLRYWRDTRYPGTIGLFPRVLGQFVRDERLLTLEEAVRKMSSFAMQRLGIKDRGVIERGRWADITVFNKETVALRGPNPDPQDVRTFYPTGIHYVIVNGQVAIKGQEYTGVRVGQVLRR